MASSTYSGTLFASLTSSNYDKVKMIATYQVESQSISNNQTTFKLRVYAHVSSSYSGGYGSDYSTIKVANKTVKTGSYRYYGVGYTLVGSTTLVVNHNSSGTFPTTPCTLSVYSFHFKNTPTSTGNLSAPTIPRTASITIGTTANTTLNTSSVRVDVTIGTGAGHYIIQCKYPNGNWFNHSSYHSGGLKHLYFNQNDLASYIGSHTSGTLRIRCLTYSDSGFAHHVGTCSEKQVSITIPNNSVWKPSLSIALTKSDGKVPTDTELYVRNDSTVEVCSSSSPASGASIQTYKVYENDVYKGDGSSRCFKISALGLVTIKVTVTDSRGFSTSISKTLNSVDLNASVSYIGVEGKAKPIKNIYVGVDGKAKKVKKIYVGVDGKAKVCYINV